MNLKIHTRKILISTILLSLIITTGCSTMNNTGLVSGSLQQCPSSPNCVCSIDKDEAHQIAPLTYDANQFSTAEVQAYTRDIISSISGLKLASETENYQHAIATSFLFRFKDDLELHFTEGQIEIRSASRVGHSDFSVNKKRVEHIRVLFEQKLALKTAG